MPLPELARGWTVRKNEMPPPEARGRNVTTG
jgi:hypothetical protein